MENHGGRGEGEITEGNNTGIEPTAPLLIIHEEHMIGENMTEGERLVSNGFLRGVIVFDNTNVHIRTSI